MSIKAILGSVFAYQPLDLLLNHADRHSSVDFDAAVGMDAVVSGHDRRRRPCTYPGSQRQGPVTTPAEPGRIANNVWNP
jgi:hypothetical protein